MAKIRRIYNPLDIAVTVSAIESSLRQDYDVNYKRFTPDRRLVPTVVQPIVTLRDSAGLVDDGVINSKLIPESIKYYRTYYDAVLGKSVRKEITNDINYTIDTTSNSDNRGRITIRQNFIQENTTTITFQATYIDYVNVGGTNKERRRASVSESFTLITDTLAQPEPLLIVDTPIGISYNPLKDLKWLNMVADLRVGQESIPSAYWWYKKDGAVETLLGEKYVGHNKRDIRIPSYEIGNKQDYVVKVQDCRNELEQLKNEYIDTEIAKNAITTSDGDIVLNNLIVNGDFRRGLERWSGLSSGTTINGNVLTVTVTDQYTGYGQSIPPANGSDLYYFSGELKSDIKPLVWELRRGPSTGGGGVALPLTSWVANEWIKYSNVGVAKIDATPISLIAGATTPVTFNIRNWIFVNLTQTFGAGNEPTKEEMDAYLADKPFITNTEDVRAEADKLTLPEGYRPAPVAAKQKTAQLTLATQYPEYDVRVVTDYGDDATVIEIPSNVYKFEAWVEIHTASGLLQNPQNYFDIDWGNDVNGNPQKGQKITVFSEMLGLGIYNLEPTVTERVLNSSIAGKQTVVGARILHLSEYADERPIPFNLKGLTVTNEVENGNFENGLIESFSKSDGLGGASTLAINSSTPISGNYDIRFTITTAAASNLRPYLTGLDGAGNIGDKIYLHFYAKILSGTPIIARIHDGLNATAIYGGDVINGRNTRIIDVVGTSNELGIIYFNSMSAWDMQMDNFMRINLTETFGAGNEPTKEWCDEYFANYFEGTQSVDAPVRIKSVGKNLWVEPREEKLFDSLSSASIVDLGEYIKITGPGSLTKKIYLSKGTYKLVADGYGDSGALRIVGLYLIGGGGGSVGYINVGASRGVNTSTDITIPESGWYEFRYYPSNSNSTGHNMYIYSSMLIRADASSSYEPYIESNLYIDDNTKLRSFPNGVKDEIRSDGKGGYEMVKRIDDLGVELATPIIIPLLTSGSLISRPNGTVYVENVVANAGVYTDKFSVMDVDLEIKALESIAKIDYQTGEATQLDVSKAVLGDTFFTHPDLEDKDIVYVNYVYKHSNVYGEASVEYYNVID